MGQYRVFPSHIPCHTPPPPPWHVFHQSMVGPHLATPYDKGLMSGAFSMSQHFRMAAQNQTGLGR